MNLKKTNTYIINWLKSYCKKANSNGFVVGVSGGVDSALTATLAAQTGLPVLCVEMPIYQPKNQVSRAKKQINFLKQNHSNLSSIEVELTEVFDMFSTVLPPVTNNENWEKAMVNTRARLRMTTLYYFAGLHGYLVVGTGNKVEDFGIGFFTKYGDGGVDLSPIADLNKSEVFKLGKFLNVIPEILNAAPTDGLWGDDRSDEDQIGATYSELEWAMNYTGNTNLLTIRQKEVLEIYRHLNKINQHKMNPIPVCKIPEEFK